MIYPVPTKRDIDSACLLVNGLTPDQRSDLLRAATDACSHEVRERSDVLMPFLNGFLVGYMARENAK